MIALRRPARGANASPSSQGAAAATIADRPIIVLGVPRSGTTLLRVLLGSHPSIHAASETPWICGGYGANSLRHLAEFLKSDPTGPVANMTGISDDDVLAAARAFVTTILKNYRTGSGKERILIKTPNDLGELDFLVRLFPEADYVHICRDGRDVACSTVRQKGKFFSARLGRFGKLTLHSALERWKTWEGEARQAIATGRIARAISCRYEDLVAQPETVLASICEFIGISYTPRMLDFADQRHDLPAWEAGSQDVRRHATIDRASVGQWKRLISAAEFERIDAEFGDTLAAYGYPLCRDAVGCERAAPTGATLSRALTSCGHLARAIALGAIGLLALHE